MSNLASLLIQFCRYIERNAISSFATNSGRVKAPLWGFFILLQKLFLARKGGVEDAIASSDITKDILVDK